MEALFDSYDHADFAWPADPQGVHFGFGHLRLRPSDLARIGELYRSEGVFEGNRIVSVTWIAQATSPQIDQGDASTTNYGYQWWIESPQGYFYAQGPGGTIVLVHPAKDAVIVVASQIDGHENFESGVLADESARLVAESVLATLDDCERLSDIRRSVVHKTCSPMRNSMVPVPVRVNVVDRAFRSGHPRRLRRPRGGTGHRGSTGLPIPSRTWLDQGFVGGAGGI